MARYKKFNGVNYQDKGWSRLKSNAEDFEKSLRSRGYKVRVIRGKSSDGDDGWKIYARKRK